MQTSCTHVTHDGDAPHNMGSARRHMHRACVRTRPNTQILLVGGNVPSGQVESVDGVTPPMRNARARHFKSVPKVDREVIARVEADLLSILQVRIHTRLRMRMYVCARAWCWT